MYNGKQRFDRFVTKAFHLSHTDYIITWLLLNNAHYCETVTRTWFTFVPSAYSYNKNKYVNKQCVTFAK